MTDQSTVNTFIAAAAGSISGLAFMPWETMTWPKRLMTIFVGFSCGIYVAPWAAHLCFDLESMKPDQAAKTIAMMTFGVAVGAHVILPWMIRRLVKIAEDRTS